MVMLTLCFCLKTVNNYFLLCQYISQLITVQNLKVFIQIQRLKKKKNE